LSLISTAGQATIRRLVLSFYGSVVYNYSAHRRPPVARKRRDIGHCPN